MTYLLRDINPALWRRVKAKAAQQGISVKALLLDFLTKWAAVVVVAVALAGCGESPMGPSASGDAFRFPEILRPAMAALDEDPWIHPLLGEPMGPWVRRNLAGIVLDDSLPTTIGARFDPSTHMVRWNPTTPALLGIPILASQILHEARHGQGFRHTCDGAGEVKSDRTMEEGGAFAVQILYLEHHQWDYAAALRRDYIGCH